MSCLSPKTPTPDTTLQDQSTAIARADFENFKRNYAQLADELTEASTSPEVVAAAVDRAAARVNPAFDVAEGMTRRSLSRSSTPLANDQKELLLKSHATNRTRATVHAKNSARDAAVELQDQVRGDVLSLGQGYKDSSTGDYAAAASLEGQRNMTNINNAAQHKASLYGLAGEAAGIASTAMILSSRKAKKNIKPADGGAATRELSQLRVKKYQYKEGAGPAGERTGVIAEDSPQIATADRSAVKAGDWMGKLTLGFQEQGKRLDALQKDVLQLKKRVS
ncbi:MAG TPA: tail fiber domain-containing protein [Pseudomonadales bacterium]